MQEGLSGNGNNGHVGDRKIGLIRLFLDVLKHIAILGDARSLGVLCLRFELEINNIKPMESFTVLLKMVQEILGGDGGVEGTVIFRLFSQVFSKTPVMKL